MDSIKCTNRTTQADMCLIRVNTNNMREYFESPSSYLIEVDPYRRSSHRDGHNSDVSTVDFKAGRGSSGVDLQWHPKEDFIKLSQEKNDKLRN